MVVILTIQVLSPVLYWLLNWCWYFYKSELAVVFLHAHYAVEKSSNGAVVSVHWRWILLNSVPLHSLDIDHLVFRNLHSFHLLSRIWLHVWNRNATLLYVMLSVRYGVHRAVEQRILWTVVKQDLNTHIIDFSSAENNAVYKLRRFITKYCRI